MATRLPHDVERVVCELLADLGSPLALEVSHDILKGDWSTLVQRRVDPRLYDDPEIFFRDYQAVELLRKCDGLDTGIDTTAAAKESFYRSEAQCHATNRRLRPYLENWGHTHQTVRFMPVLDMARKICSRVLGNIPENLDGRFGPGATADTPAERAHLLGKISQSPATTAAAQALVPLWQNSAWERGLVADGARYRIDVLPGNTFFCVNKDATTKRGACKEPSLNVWFQLSIGREMRDRLRRGANIDLASGQDLHAELSRKASLDGEDATIDLKSASDTNARVLPKLVLPETWFDLLDTLRSPKTYIDGRWVYLEKFSSMGNGFTFELETLIFYALAKAAIEVFHEDQTARVSVYGDDIIVPTRYSRTVLDTLAFFGFTPNDRKTFTTGHFRESCGGDYFAGVNCSPVRITEIPHDPATWIALINNMWRVSTAHYGLVSHGPFERARNTALCALPSDVRRCRGPAHLGDLVITDHPDTWTKVTRAGIPYFRVWRPVFFRLRFGYWRVHRRKGQKVKTFKVSKRWRPGAVLAAALYGCPESGIVPRGAVTGYRFGWVACHGDHPGRHPVVRRFEHAALRGTLDWPAFPQ